MDSNFVHLNTLRKFSEERRSRNTGDDMDVALSNVVFTVYSPVRILKNRKFKPTICRFHMAKSWEILATENFLRSRRAPRAYTQIPKLENMTNLHRNYTRCLIYSSDFMHFWFLCFASSSIEILQARKLLTSLRFFVKKNFSRSHTAPSDCT